MNELITPDDFPNIAEGVRRARKLFEGITSIEDLERTFLKGNGLAPDTYASYRLAIRQFHEFTKGKHPLTVTPGDIEAFYDDLLAKGYDRNTAYFRMAGLRKFFRGIADKVPQYVSPFDLMPPKLRKKVGRFRTGARTKAALTPDEIRALLDLLREQDPDDFPIVFMLVTSGLRAAEICCLRWRDLDCADGQWTARFVGKGGKDATQELYAPAVDATRARYESKVGRPPRSEDALFVVRHGNRLRPVDAPPPPSKRTVALGDVPSEALKKRRRESWARITWRPLDRKTLWLRIRAVGERARAAGIAADRDLQWSPHLFRRSFATSLYKSGMGLRAIQHLTRHSTIEILARHYIDDHERSAPHFDKMFGGQQ